MSERLKPMSKPEYEAWTASTRDARMAWWRDARFGMIIHFGLYSTQGRHEWLQTQENIPIEEYERFADEFRPKEGAPREWVKFAKAAGMKYAVLTTRHHEGFSLWDSKVNPYNSVNYGPHRDIVREFVDACREFDLKIGLYSSMMDWHHPDGWKCAYDLEARKRFNQYLTDLNAELLTNYGKFDILWYDCPCPMETWDGWDSVARNRYLRSLQPDIIINNRSVLAEDFGTPEGQLMAENRDWEACMTFNGLSWGYVDSEQVRPYSYSAQQILMMLSTCAAGGGNLLLNIGPAPDGSVPQEAIEPLTQVGKWLAINGEAAYGKKVKRFSNGGGWGNFDKHVLMGNGVTEVTGDGKKVYLWNKIWPKGGTMGLGGWFGPPKRAYLLESGAPVDFEWKGHRIILKNLPEEIPDKVCGVSVIVLEFDELPGAMYGSYYPQLHQGQDIAGANKL